MNLASPFCHAAYGAGRCVHATYACFPREIGGGEGLSRCCPSGPERGAQTDGEVCPEMGWESPEGWCV